MRIAPPCLLSIADQQPGTSSPPSWLKRFFAGISSAWTCMQGLLDQQLLPLPWSSAAVSSQWIGCSSTHALLQPTSPSSLSRRYPGVPSVSSPVSVWSLRCRLGSSWRVYGILHSIAYQEVMSTLVNIKRRVCDPHTRSEKLGLEAFSIRKVRLTC